MAQCPPTNAPDDFCNIYYAKLQCDLNNGCIFFCNNLKIFQCDKIAASLRLLLQLSIFFFFLIDFGNKVYDLKQCKLSSASAILYFNYKLQL